METTKKPGVLILGNHVQALGTARCLGRRKIPVYLANDKPLCISRFSRYVKKFFVCPPITDDSKVTAFLLGLAKTEGLIGWMIMPSNDAAVYSLSKNKKALEEFYKIPTPAWEITELAYNKKLTYALAEKNGIPIPPTFYPASLEDLKAAASKLKFPVIVKPAVMHTFYSKTKTKAIKAENMDELIAAYKAAAAVIDPSEIMVQEVIPGRPGELYSYCSFFKQGESKGGMVGRRARQRPMDFGKGTTFAYSVKVPQLEEYGKKLLAAMDYYGASEVEFKTDPRDGVHKLLEVNARTWLWHSLAARCGVDVPYMVYRDLVDGVEEKAPSYRENVRWLHFYTDLSVVLGEIIKGNMSVGEYLSSLIGEKEYAVYASDDPLPFIAETVLLPYLKMVR